MEGNAEISSLVVETPEKAKELSPKERVTEALKSGLSIFETIPPDKKTKAQEIEIDEIKRRLEDIDKGGNGRQLVELKNEKGRVIKRQEEGIPVDEMLTCLENKWKEAKKNKNKKEADELQAIIKSLTPKKYCKDYFDPRNRWVPRFFQARVAEEMDRMQKDGRSSGDINKDKELAEITLKNRRELFIPKSKEGGNDDDENDPSLLKELRYTVGIANNDNNALKMARESGGEYVRSQLNISEQVKNKRNPLEWMGKFARAVRFRWGEEYYKYGKANEHQSEAIRRGIYLAGFDSVTGAYKEVADAREIQRKEGAASAERIVKGGLNERGEESQKLENVEFGKKATSLITQFARGEITQEQLVTSSTELVEALKNNPDLVDYIKNANFLGNNILEVAQRVKNDYETGVLKGLENLDEKMDFQVGRVLMGANTEADYSRIEKSMNRLQGGKYRSLLANPLVIGVAFGFAGAGTKSILGWSARTASGFPLAGAALGGVFAGLRRWTEIKRDFELNERDTTYSRTSEGGRRKKLNEFSLNTAEGGGKVNAKGLLEKMQNLSAADLKVEASSNALIDQIAEINARVDYGIVNKVDLLAYSDRFVVGQERLQLVIAQQEAINKLKESGLTQEQINLKIKESKNKFLGNFAKMHQEQKRKLDRFRIIEAAKSGFIGAATGLTGGIITQEIWAGIGRGVFHQEIGATVLERVGKGQLNPLEWMNPSQVVEAAKEVRVPGFASDTAKELYQHPRNIEIGQDFIMRAFRDKNGIVSVDFVDSAGNKLLRQPAHLLENGGIVFSGSPDALPDQVKQFIGAQGWESKPYTNPDFNLQQKIQGLINTGGKEIFTHGDTVISVDAENGTASMLDVPTKNQLYGTIGPDGSFIFKTGTGEISNLNVNWQEMQIRLGSEGWGMSEEAVIPEPKPSTDRLVPQSPKGIIDYFREHPEAGNVRKALREYWHDNDTPIRRLPDGRIVGADGKELQFYHRVLPPTDTTPRSVQLDFSKMHSQLMPDNTKGINWDQSIDSQYNRLVKDIASQPDGSRSYKNFEILITPDKAADDAREVVILKGADHPEIAKGLLNLKADSPEVEAFFNLDENGNPILNKYGNFQKVAFIEVAHVEKDEFGNDIKRTILSTTQGPGVSEITPPPKVERDVVGPPVPFTKYEFTPPQTVEFDPPPPTFLPPPVEAEPPPFIPIPFAPRHPLESLKPSEKSHLIYPHIYRLEPSPEQIRDFERRRSPRLRNNSKAYLSASEEINWYFEQQDPQYVVELNELNNQIGQGMDNECRLCVTMPVAAHQEEANIYKALENYANQKDRLTQQPLDRRQFEILIFLNRPADKNPDGTESEINRFITDHSDVKVVVAKRIFRPEEVKYGRIVKYLADLALLRSKNRDNPIKQDVILVTNDADSTAMSTYYIQDMFIEFDKPENKNIDGILGKLEWSQEAYDKYPIIHAATRFAQFMDAVYHHGDYPRLGSSGGNFALRSSIYAAIGGYFANTGAGADQDLSRLIRYARVGRLEGIQQKDYPIKYLNKAWLESNPRRGVDYYKRGVPIIDQWDDFNARMKTDDPARLNKWQEITTDSESLDDFNINRLESEMNAILSTYEMEATDPSVNRALAWMGIKANIVNGKLKITDSSKLMSNLRKYRDEKLSQLKKADNAGVPPSPSPTPEAAIIAPREASTIENLTRIVEQRRATIDRLVNEMQTASLKRKAELAASVFALSNELSVSEANLLTRKAAKAAASAVQRKAGKVVEAVKRRGKNIADPKEENVTFTDEEVDDLSAGLDNIAPSATEQVIDQLPQEKSIESGKKLDIISVRRLTRQYLKAFLQKNQGLSSDYASNKSFEQMADVMNHLNQYLQAQGLTEEGIDKNKIQFLQDWRARIAKGDPTPPPIPILKTQTLETTKEAGSQPSGLPITEQQPQTEQESKTEHKIVLGQVINFSALIDFEKALETIPEVKAFYVSDFRGRNATLKIRLKDSETVDQLGAKIRSLSGWNPEHTLSFVSEDKPDTLKSTSPQNVEPHTPANIAIDEQGLDLNVADKEKIAKADKIEEAVRKYAIEQGITLEQAYQRFKENKT